MVQPKLATLLALVAAAALALALSVPGGAASGPLAHAAHKAKRCGAAPSGDHEAEYRLTVTKGKVKCRTARKVLLRFIHTGKSAHGWDCRNGAADTAWSEACGSPYHSLYDTFRDRNFKRVIKAYYRLDS